MRSLDLYDPAQVLPHLALATTRGPGGPIHHRYPLAHIDAFGPMAPIARFQTGIELQICGPIRQLRITVRVVESDHYGVCAELYRGPHKLLPTWHLDSRDPGPQTFTFDTVMALAPDLTDIPLRFIYPTHTILEILDIAVDPDASVTPRPRPWTYNDLTDARPLHLIAYGDSITHGANVTCPTGTWVDMLAKTLCVAPANLANGGHGKAELSMAHHIASRPQVDLISLHMGVNCIKADTADTYAQRFDQFLAIIRAAHPSVPIIAVSPIWSVRDRLPPGMAPQDIRQGTETVCRARRAAGDPHIHYINGLDLRFRHHHLNGDWLHINEHGAAHYYATMLPILQPIVDTLRASA